MSLAFTLNKAFLKIGLCLSFAMESIKGSASWRQMKSQGEDSLCGSKGGSQTSGVPQGTWLMEGQYGSLVLPRKLAQKQPEDSVGLLITNLALEKTPILCQVEEAGAS